MNPLVPMFQGLSAMLGSRKAMVGLSAIAAVTFLAHAGKVDGGQAMDFIKYVVMTFIGAQAVEDAAKHMSQKGTASTAVQNVAVGLAKVPAAVTPTE